MTTSTTTVMRLMMTRIRMKITVMVWKPKMALMKRDFLPAFVASTVGYGG